MQDFGQRAWSPDDFFALKILLYCSEYETKRGEDKYYIDNQINYVNGQCTVHNNTMTMISHQRLNKKACVCNI